jgi:hypothetical protein
LLRGAVRSLQCRASELVKLHPWCVLPT